MSLLDVKNLHVYYATNRGVIKSVEGLNLYIKEGEIIGLVGESGSGKTVTSSAIMQLVDEQNSFMKAEYIKYKDTNLLDLSTKELESIRGNEISIIFQDPMDSLNPLYTIGYQISEPLIKHQKMSKEDALEYSIELLKQVGVPSPSERINEYPHQMSGGMCQRVMIAMSLAANPNILIADEPTTSLDVTIQSQVLKLLKKLSVKNNLSILLITHDLGIILDMCDRVYVMYAGQIVEQANIKDLVDKPLHPYTEGLLNSMPFLDKEYDRLPQIPGNVPIPIKRPTGCRFHPRCSKAIDKCKTLNPTLTKYGDREVRCHLVKVGDD